MAEFCALFSYSSLINIIIKHNTKPKTMGISTTIYTATAILAVVLQLVTSLPTAEKCSPILPAPISHCSAGSISTSRRSLLNSIVRGNLSEIEDRMTEIVTRAHCHPDYLGINSNESERTFNPSFHTSDFTDVGRSAYYLKSCFILNISSLADSESDHHINGEQIYFDTQLRIAEQNVVNATTALIELARSDPRLTEGSNCEPPPVTCRPFPRLQTNLTAGQTRYWRLVITAQSLKRYASDLYRSDYWEAVQ